jgi:hypothetical protein
VNPDTRGSLVHNSDLEGPTNRSFGLTVGGILFALGVVRSLSKGSPDLLAALLLVIGGALFILGLFKAAWLTGANRAWMRLGAFMARIVNPVVLLLIYLVAFIPVGILMRLKGYNPLRQKRVPKTDSYWIVRKKTDDPASGMLNQF